MSDSVTLAVTDHVPMEAKARYEALVEELHRLFEAQNGFLSVDTVRHSRPHQVEYTVLSRWSDEAAVTQWRENPAIREKLTQIEAITGGPAQHVQAIGLGMWVDHADGSAPHLPPAWKRTAMSAAAVYPMLMLLMALSSPIIGGLPQFLQVLIIVIVLSALLTWPIMPWLSKVLRPWLMAR
ncbi:antibiotic biosynthesis monooxygenase [Phaeobacter inhibens]|uniref:antibiotic biosynthesis monooxygenase n=1 Tax=Phaeobacter inhibens TaxID=221822 RepID=UPI0021A86BD6|nr:antibiotic biosynthesis monooxygenase [Phaeobacter inhibens]UWR84004.1 antibiotic biosynthesis monooxygenase [Phaeobacter inhibens]UWR91988.1 antibiotic biosynthesis monooxygenase [Phaeobacter inhibens]UWS07623.1 antibiotic biosynthesis monooxygenase [Phaeobacter inhibens]